MPKNLLIILFLGQICLARPVLADEQRQSIAGIRQAAVEFLAAKLQTTAKEYEIVVALPDSRLELARCAQPLDVFLQSGGIDKGSVSVGVRCGNQVPWTVYLLAQIKKFQSVLVLTRAVERGAVLTQDDIGVERQDVTRLRQGYLTESDQAVHLQAKRSLSAGFVLNGSVLERPKLIRRGQLVAIIAQSATLDIRMQGKALMDGAAGQRVSVRNEKSSRVVEGVVAAPGVVKVAF